jgi:tetratricopeptide (TPR) repeat protein
MRGRTAFYLFFFVFSLMPFEFTERALAVDESLDLPSITRRVEDSSASEQDLNKLSEFIAREPNNAKLHYLLGFYMEQKGFEQLALDSYDRAIKCDSGFKPAHYQRCLVLLRVDDLEEGMKEMQLCEQLFASDGDKLFRIGQALEQCGKRDDAKRLYQKSTLSGHKERGRGVTLAKIRLQQGKWDEALEAVEWDLKNNPNDGPGNLVKAEILLRAKRDEDAMACYLRAAKGGPCADYTAMTVAQKFLERKRYADALTASLFGLLCPPKDPAELERTKAQVSDLIVRLPEKETQRALESVSLDVQKLRRCRYFRLALGDIFDRLNRPQRAMEQYQLAIHDCSSPMMDNNILARGYYRLGRDYETKFRNHREALDLYRRANMISPNDREIQANYIRLTTRMKNRKNDVSAHIKDAWYSLWKSSKN